MCGIHGSTNGRAIGPAALAHRGPDSYGTFSADGVVLEHWRLSIIDLSSNGAQPMKLGDDELVIAYNGEVYNFNELRREIRDAEFKSGTDTEVVLRLYREQGLACLAKFNGMFAFAIYDKANRKLVLARDRFGIKPIYYHVDDKGDLMFCSELKALMLGHEIDPAIDVDAIRSLFHLLYIEGESTPFTRVRKLPAGSYLVYDLDTKKIEIGKYKQLEFRPHGLSDAECVDAIDGLLSKSVQMHLVADVPVGALLSGGVDSSVMVAMMTKHTDHVHTFSVGYADSKLFDESRYFNHVAKQYKTEHHHTVVRQDALGALVDEVCGVMDEPIGDTSVFLNYFIFGFVARSVKVCLSGLGGDELFGGYNRYLACKILPVYAGLPSPVRAGVQALVSVLPSSRQSRIGNRVRLVKTFLERADADLGKSYASFIDYFAEEAESPVLGADRFDNTRLRADWDDELVDRLNRIYKYDIENYMVNDLLSLTDRMSMRHSLEARVPYLENELVDFALGIEPARKIQGRTMKYHLKKVAERYLPKEVIYRRKQGFSSPVKGLLDEALLRELSRELRDGADEYVRILNAPLFERLIAEHRTGQADHSLQIFTLFVYLRWMRTCFAQLGSRAQAVTRAPSRAERAASR